MQAECFDFDFDAPVYFRDLRPQLDRWDDEFEAWFGEAHDALLSLPVPTRNRRSTCVYVSKSALCILLMCFYAYLYSFLQSEKRVQALGRAARASQVKVRILV